MGDGNFLDKAIEIMKTATAEDHKENYREAYDLYLRGLEYFKLAVKYEKVPARKERVQLAMIKYVDRAEKLKEHLENPQPKKKVAAAGGGDDDDGERDKMKGNLMSAIVKEKPNVHWDDVAGLDVAKESLKEAVILPIRFPQLFTGKRKPWRGILLYGPPGTGKSYLAKAVATEADSCFLSIASSDLVSKYLGESEKLVRGMFELARESKPAIIFLDEIDSLCRFAACGARAYWDSARSDNESESARRIKTEFLVQMQGVGNSQDGVLVLAATNLPWNIDAAIRRRFEKRIYIPLPESAARRRMFEIHLAKTTHTLELADIKYLGQHTDGYSGSDVSVVVRDAIMEPIRKLQTARFFRQTSGRDPTDPEHGEMMHDLWSPCSERDQGAMPMTLMDIADPNKLKPPDVCMADFDKILQKNRPSVGPEDLLAYKQFTEEFGQEG